MALAGAVIVAGGALWWFAIARRVPPSQRLVEAPSVQLPLRLRQAETLHYRRHRLADAERAYRAALELAPDNIEANTGLANLLSLCGRMREVTPYVLRVIRQGGEPDLLLLLVRGEVAVDNVELLTQARQADPADPNPLVGLAWHAIQKERTQEAEDLLQTALRQDTDNVPARLLMGRLLLSANRSTEFAAWATQLPSAADDFAESWLIRGQMAEAVNHGPGVIRCYWEAVRRGPESKTATFRLAHGLAEAGETRAAEVFRDRVEQMVALEEIQNRVLFTADRGRPELLLPLAQAYESAGRLWEAFGWCQFAVEVGVKSAELTTCTERLRRKLKNEPLQLVTDSANVALTIDLSHYPLPDLRPGSTPASRGIATSDAVPTFRDDAQAVGLTFRYFNGVTGPPTHRMFEFTGGGIGVLDFDLDAWPDLFLTQGCTWPPGAVDASGGDRIFRNRAGTAFEDVTQRAGLLEYGFGQGVSIGDFNSDGFPDVYVANIGANTLWLNHGDGTFADVTAVVFADVNGSPLRVPNDEHRTSSPDWTTSTVMVDLTGDGLPDIYDVNYVTAEDVFDRVCLHTDGSLKLCMPHDFHGQPDRLWRNLGDGRFREATTEVLGEAPLGMGLGVAAWDAEGAGRLSLFVANDTTACFYFRPEAAGENTDRLRECGIVAGLAFNGAGKATGCMGVAVGDVDDDGRMDLHVTNFYAEPNTLFLNSVPGFFEDRTRQAGLEDPSLNMLGFGTQFLDADLDGRLELFVANGHVDDLSRLNRPYRMRPQLFRGDAVQGFHELSPAELGTYFQNTWLGRSAVRLDWNRDGREDLAIGHLDAETALLTNTTAEVGRHLSLRLVGVKSNRDAIGTSVTARVGHRTIARQVTAGDGYQASNERRLIVGTGLAEFVDELTVRWPSGSVQKFQDVSTQQEWWLREGMPPVTMTHAE